MDDNAVPVLQLDDTVDGHQVHQVAKKATIYKVCIFVEAWFKLKYLRQTRWITQLRFRVDTRS